MSDLNQQILDALHEMRDLLRVIAEPQLAERDRKLRSDLLRIAGKSVSKQKAVLLMDGTHTQVDILRKVKGNQGHLSTLVKQLLLNKLIAGDSRHPKLVISIPADFFEKEMKNE